MLFVVAALTATVSTTTQARCNQELVRYAQSLHGTAESLVREFREDVRHRPICSTEREFLSTIGTVESLTDRFYDGAAEGESPACLERSFCSMQRSFSYAQQLAQNIRLCGCVRDLMCKFERTLCSVRSSGLLDSTPAPVYRERDDRYYDHHERHSVPQYREPEYRRSSSPRPESILLEGLMHLLQRR